MGAVNDDRISAIEALLDQAKDAHGVYEEKELNGVYDEAWPAWYGAYAVEHGLGDILGHEVAVDRVSDFLTRTWDEFRSADPHPAEGCSGWTARRIAADL